MRCRDEKAATTFKILEGNIASKPLARCAEALLAARAIDKDPGLVRGGPWLLPDPGPGWRREVAKVAAMSSYLEMHAYAEGHEDGNLHRHLKGLKFMRPDEAGKGVQIKRGAAVATRKKSGRSGCNGNASRTKQLARGALKRGSDYLRRVWRGKAPAACRKRESAKRGCK